MHALTKNPPTLSSADFARIAARHAALPKPPAKPTSKPTTASLYALAKRDALRAIRAERD